MYKILIVDDEEVERDGIKFLISKYKIDLEIAEAENGKKALKYLHSNHVDILLTDIKMPFMDGLDLSHEAKKINPKIKIIIFSAYGEFDYAKKAIENNILSYLLKPIVINEFLDVIQNAVNICSKEEEEHQRIREITESYRRILIYEKEKIMLDLINGKVLNDDFKARVDLTQLGFIGKYSNILVIDMQSKFFDSRNDDFEEFLNSLVECGYEYLNLNEYQSIVFLYNSEKAFGRSFLKQQGEIIIKEISSRYHLKPYLILGKPINRIEDFANDYTMIEQILDLKFIYEAGTVLFASEVSLHTQISEGESGGLLKDTYNAIDSVETGKTVIRKVMGIIESEYMSDISLEYIAEKVYLSPSYLSYLFKKETDHSFIKFLTLYRLKKAKELLDHSNMRIIDIGECVGYSNLSYFCMLFKNNYGMTPAKYRERGAVN